jgi:hypothetical protein
MDVVQFIGGVAADANAIAKVIQTLNEPRSVILEVDNNTSDIVTRLSDNHQHGGFSAVPHGTIAAKGTDVFGSQSASWSVATGTEGTVTYQGNGYTLTIYWDNPFLGSNNCSINIAGPNAEQYRVVATCGNGNQKAQMRYEIFPFGAEFEGQQNVPNQMSAGANQSVSITVKNLGMGVWTSANRIKLGSQNPQDNTSWGLNRVELPNDVPPGGTVTLTFNITAPKCPGTHHFQWRMVWDGVSWFGATSQDTAVEVMDSASCAQLRGEVTDLVGQIADLENEGDGKPGQGQAQKILEDQKKALALATQSEALQAQMERQGCGCIPTLHP